MALAIQAVVAAVAAGVIARSLGNEQTLVVAWTALVIIAGSAGPQLAERVTFTVVRAGHVGDEREEVVGLAVQAEGVQTPQRERESRIQA